MEPLNAAEIRRALRESYNGTSGRYVYARARAGHLGEQQEFRIIALKHHRGLPYGLELASGKWIVIDAWEER